MRITACQGDGYDGLKLRGAFQSELAAVSYREDHPPKHHKLRLRLKLVIGAKTRYLKLPLHLSLLDAQHNNGAEIAGAYTCRTGGQLPEGCICSNNTNLASLPSEGPPNPQHHDWSTSDDLMIVPHETSDCRTISSIQLL